MLAAVDLSPFPCQPRLIVQDLAYVSQAKQAFHRYLGVSWVKSVQDETQNCGVMCLLYYIDWMWVGNDAWCRQRKRGRLEGLNESMSAPFLMCLLT